MMYSADFRESARDALQNNWIVAIVTGFVAYLMGAGITTSGNIVSLTGDINSINSAFQNVQVREFWAKMEVFLAFLFILVVAWGAIIFIISGAAKLGYASFNLKLIDKKKVTFSDLFSQFDRFGAGFCMNFLVGLYTALWSLLFVIPGIMKRYSYMMTPYILAENPNMTVSEAIRESCRLMYGKRVNLFTLEFSFFGWKILFSAPMLIALVVLINSSTKSGNVAVLLWLIPFIILLVIGLLWIGPYQEAAYAAFYREISGTAQAIEEIRK